jgi:amino acid transporter
MNSTAEQTEQLPRKLGVWGLWLLVVNGLIGAGIFGLPSGAARLAGEYSLFIYLLCALLILPVFLCFAELGSYFKGTGGPVRYGTAAFGPFIGFQAGWLYYMARLISFAANSVLLTDSIGYFFEPAAEGYGRLITLAVIIGGFTLINIIGSVQSIRSLAVFTVFKFAVLILLVFGGLIMLGGSVAPSFQNAVPDFSDLGAAALLLIYAFVGFEGAVVPAGEAKSPHKDMPKALLFGLLSVAALYLLIQMVAQAAVPDLGQSSAPLLDASGVLFGTTGAIILMIGVVTSVAGNLISAMFSTPRLTYALALQGDLPSWFGKVHQRFKTPANSILFFGICAFAGAAMGSFTLLAAMTVLSRLFLYIISCLAVPKLRSTHSNPNTFTLKGKALIPILGVLSCLWLMLQVSVLNIWMTTLFVVIGSALYGIGHWQKKKAEA